MSGVVTKQGCVWSVALTGLMSLALTGCGGESLPPTYPITAVVRMDGQPFGPCMVMLHPTAGSTGRAAVGVVSADGKVEFTSFKKGDGATAGEYKVTVRSHVSGAPPKPIPADFQSEAKTTLRITVAATGTNEAAFDLVAGKGGRAPGEVSNDAFQSPAFSAGAGSSAE
jgi:hypothetical protein